MRRQWLLTVLMTCGLIGAMTTTSDAQPIPARHRHQQARIVRGLRSGQLTVREFRRLERRQARIGALERRLRLSGGVFTPCERRIVQRALDRQSHQIFRERHDSARRRLPV